MSQVNLNLGYAFKDVILLEHAITHPSVYSASTKRQSVNHFERLEFLGDRVLGLIVGRMLYEAFPSVAEGELSRRLAWLVCRDTLASVAETIGIHKTLKYARATDENNAQWVTFLSDACEAVIGAVYLDGGIDAATKLIHQVWAPLLHQEGMAKKDPKTELQEYVQGRFKLLPTYVILSQVGPSHEPQITVECTVNNYNVTATANSRKRAENACAVLMLQQLNKI